MIYGSRGTQTERDVLLMDRGLACKAIVLIERSLYATVIKRSLAGKSWEEMSQVAKVITYAKADLPKPLIKKVCDLMQQMRAACYVRDMRRRVLNGN